MQTPILLLVCVHTQPHVKPTVTWEDQQNINKFSTAFQQQGELEALLQAQKKLVDDLDDASAEMMLADDDEQVKMQVGARGVGGRRSRGQHRSQAGRQRHV